MSDVDCTPGREPRSVAASYFTLFVVNFYLILYLYVYCHGLRLSHLNKETTYLRTISNTKGQIKNHHKCAVREIHSQWKQCEPYSDRWRSEGLWLKVNRDVLRAQWRLQSYRRGRGSVVDRDNLRVVVFWHGIVMNVTPSTSSQLHSSCSQRRCYVLPCN